MKTQKLLLSFVFLILLCSFASADVDDAVAYYSFDNTNVNGSDPLDSSGNGNDGAGYNIATNQLGKLKQAFYYETGDGSIVDLQNVLLPTSSSGSFGVSLWFYINDTSLGAQHIFDQYITGDAGRYTIFSESNNLRIYKGGSVTSITSISSGVWYHLILNSSGTSFEVMLNNLVVYSGTDAAKTNINTSLGSGFLAPTGNLASMTGLIDEVGIYNHAFTTSDVDTLYNSGDGFNPYGVLDNFTVTVTNTNTFNATVNGTLYQTSDGTIVTNILNTEPNLYNISINAKDFLDRNFSDYNVSTNLEVTLTDEVSVNVSYFGYVNDSNDLYLNGDLTLQYHFFNCPANQTFSFYPNGTLNSTEIVNCTGSDVLTNVTYSSPEGFFNTSFSGTYQRGAEFEEYSFAGLNFTADYTNPNVYLLQPMNSSSFTVNLSEYISFNDSLTYVSNCSVYWLNTGNGSTTTTLCNETVNFGGPAVYDINITAEDIAGNINLTPSSFVVNVDNNITFNDLSGSSNFSGVNVTVLFPDSSSVIYTTNGTGTIQIPALYNGVIQEGEYTFAFPDSLGFITPINFTESFTAAQMPLTRTYNLSLANLNINIYDRDTGELLSSLASLVFQGVGNFTTSNGTYFFENLTLSGGDLVIQAFSDGYFTEQRTVVYSNQEILNVDFYLLENNLTTSNTLKVNVLDSTQSKVDGAEVNLLEYDPATLSYISVSQCYTDSEGECNFIIELNDKTYKYTASKTINGDLLTASSGDEGTIFREDIVGGSPVTFSELERTLVLQETESYTFLDSNYLRYNITENFNETSNVSTVTVDFQTTDGSTTKVCIQFLNTDTNPDTSELLLCVTGNAGTVTPSVPFTLNRSNNYRLDIFSVNSDGSTPELGTYYYKSDLSLQETLDLYAILSPAILFLWIIIVAVSLYSGVLPILTVLGILLAVAEFALFPNYMIASGMVLKIIICLQIFYMGRKKEDFN